MVFRIVEEDGRFYLEKKGSFWGWNRVNKVKYTWYYAIYFPEDGYEELSFETEEEAKKGLVRFIKFPDEFSFS